MSKPKQCVSQLLWGQILSKQSNELAKYCFRQTLAPRQYVANILQAKKVSLCWLLLCWVSWHLPCFSWSETIKKHTFEFVFIIEVTTEKVLNIYFPNFITLSKTGTHNNIFSITKLFWYFKIKKCLIIKLLPIIYLFHILTSLYRLLLKLCKMWYKKRLFLE